MPIKLPSFRPRRDAYPPDLWTKCPSCGEMLFNQQLDKSLRVCPRCGHHFRLTATARLALLLDPGSFSEVDAQLQSVDPLGFVDQKAYPDRVLAAQTATGLRDAAIRGFGAIAGHRVAICVMDFGFMGGSMGAVVGEKVARSAEDAMDQRIPLLVVSTSGGARMQEGTLALMQLAKTVAALERLKAAGVPFVSILTDPTTGGVFASFAVLGDVNLAEPNALIGFAGARVSAGTIGAELPPGFQRSEFLYEHGFVDRVVHRGELRREVIGLLDYLQPRPAATAAVPAPTGLPGFRPLGLLSSLADRVLPPLEPLPQGGTVRPSPVAAFPARTGGRPPVTTSPGPAHHPASSAAPDPATPPAGSATPATPVTAAVSGPGAAAAGGPGGAPEIADQPDDPRPRAIPSDQAVDAVPADPGGPGPGTEATSAVSAPEPADPAHTGDPAAAGGGPRSSEPPPGEADRG